MSQLVTSSIIPVKEVHVGQLIMKSIFSPPFGTVSCIVQTPAVVAYTLIMCNRHLVFRTCTYCHYCSYVNLLVGDVCIPSTVKVKSREAETFIVVLDNFNSCMLSSSYRELTCFFLIQCAITIGHAFLLLAKFCCLQMSVTVCKASV